VYIHTLTCMSIPLRGRGKVGYSASQQKEWAESALNRTLERERERERGVSCNVLTKER
jgi:hypothetical protein